MRDAIPAQQGGAGAEIHGLEIPPGLFGEGARVMHFLSIEQFVTEHDGHPFFEQEKALVYLLTEDVVFPGSGAYVDWGRADGHGAGKSTIGIFVLCNDVHGPGSDAETVTGGEDADIGKNELYRLLSYVLADPRWGAVKYCCWKRNRQPWGRVAAGIKEDGVWDDWWEALRPNRGFG